MMTTDEATCPECHKPAGRNRDGDIVCENNACDLWWPSGYDGDEDDSAPRFNTGDQVKYVLGRTSNDMDITAKNPFTFVRYVSEERAVVRTSPDEFTRPNTEEEVWVSRLRPLA